MTSVNEAFRHWARTTPDAVALSAGPDNYTFAELDQWSDHVAHRLATEAGVRRGDHVAVCLHRSPQLIVALLGVLKAGAAYVPIDPDEPDRRLSDVLADAEVTVAVTDSEAERFPGLRVLGVTRGDGTPDVTVTADDRAYLMFTSGSTGRPKAVVIGHGNIMGMVTGLNFVEVTPADRMLQLATIAFDAATFEIWGSLLNGARLVLAPPKQVPPEDLGPLLREHGVSILFLTAALFHRQIDVDVKAFAGLHSALAGGDVLSATHIRALREACPDLQIVNCYGPTETTVFGTCHKIGPDEDLANSVPIGIAGLNASVQVVGENGQPITDGTPGELWIGGAVVGHGYWARPELTDEKFVHGFWPGASGIYYRTGDLGRMRPDGVVEFHGRIDDQFKLRGFRIEPGEVESVLASHPQVQAAAVGVRENHLNDRRLVAWVVQTGPELDRKALRAYIRDLLPEHMMPAAFVTVDAIPITANGKTDRKALPAPDWTSRSIYV